MNPFSDEQWRSRSFPFILAAVIGILLVALPCWAHKVNVFAYVEGDKIVVEGYFSKSSKAMNCVVQFFDSQGKEIHKGKTDKNGQYSVPIADLGTVAGDLLITLNVGDGHKKDYRLGAEEIPKPTGGTSKTTRQEPAGKVPESADPTKPETVVQDPGKLEAVIEAVVKRENQKIINMIGNQQRLLLEQQNAGPSVKDIVGGIGWILGIVGVIAFFMGRNRNR